MVKQLSTANTNRYKDAQTPLEVKLSFKKDSKKKVDTQAAVQQKWKKWDMGQRDAMQTLATYLFRIEKELRGLLDGQWLTPSGRTNWTELVKGASDVHDISLAVLQLEAALKSIVLAPTWFVTEEASAKRGKGRGRKKNSEKAERKKEDYDWEEMKKAGILEDTSMCVDDNKDEYKQEDFAFCWIGGNRVAPCEIALSAQSIRNVVLTAGELQLQHFVYTVHYIACIHATM